MWHIALLLYYFFVFATASYEGAVVSDPELTTLLGRLWQMDSEEMKPYLTYTLNLQGRRRKSKIVDQTPEALFSNMDWERMRQKPSVSAFIKLLDNYHAQLGIKETLTPEIEDEISRFIKEVVKTDVMRLTHLYLASHNLTSSDPNDFRERIYKLWFKPYRRRRSSDSSAFEHVFVGEETRVKAIGMHNWLQFALQENAGNVDYQGYCSTACGDPPRLITLSFETVSGKKKPRSAMVLNTSPEFELAIYTLAFLKYPHGERILIDPCGATVECHMLRRKKLIGSCYVRAGRKV
ncbi:unnamed protein product [Calicophoron daubneyi]|uniref:Uridylate-specific endoribonuclease n=1 Tax=Calicophoron daubneyi TaxID=300641 RepID=A0AAV2TID8_CALDB